MAEELLTWKCLEAGKPNQCLKPWLLVSLYRAFRFDLLNASAGVLEGEYGR